MKIQKTSSEPSQKDATTNSWPKKLNKALIAIGVIAFGLIVTDRLLEAFRADDAPEVAAVGGAPGDGSAETAANLLSEADRIQPGERKSLAELQDLIGTRIVFASTSDPGYLVTGDEQRFDVGDEVVDEFTLAGVTSHQVILEKSGRLKVFSLPDPVVQ